MLTEKKLLAKVLDEMSSSFNRHGILLVPWRFEVDAVPAVALPTDSVQTVIDNQMPRRLDGTLLFDLFVGIMDRRIGTPLIDAPSGTVHEFLEAKKSFENTGKPRILFYFRARDQAVGPADAQLAGVIKFRAQYPGLFATYTSLEDLESQFRRHLLTELLDLLEPRASREHDPAAVEWWTTVVAQYVNVSKKYPRTPIGRSPEKVHRILRQLNVLFGIESRLQASESRVLALALFSVLLNDTDREEFESLTGGSENAVVQIRDVVERCLDETKLPIRSRSTTRVDLLGALGRIGLRLDFSRCSLERLTNDPPGDAKHFDYWLASMIDDVSCERGIVRFRLVAPTAEWVEPLIGVTAVGMELLWQSTRAVLTSYGFSFAVARSRVEIDGDLVYVPGAVLELLKLRATEIAKSLPALPHFGTPEPPPIQDLLPLPSTKISKSVLFRAPRPGPVRLRVSGGIVAEDAESGVIEYFPSVGDSMECILECDEAGEFIPVVQSRLQRLSPVEDAILECAADKSSAFRSLGLWNDFLELIWSTVSSPEASQEDLGSAFHVLRNAFEETRNATDALLERHDMYWDAMELVRKRFEGGAT